MGSGLALMQLGQNEKALEAFEAALADAPTEDRALFGKAVALHQLGKLDEAGEICGDCCFGCMETRWSCWQI